jgi:hypothetical protein
MVGEGCMRELAINLLTGFTLKGAFSKVPLPFSVFLAKSRKTSSATMALKRGKQ